MILPPKARVAAIGTFGRLLPIMLALIGVSARAQVAQPIPVPDLTQPAPAPEALSVGQRAQPEYDPLGVRIGAFLLHPSLDLSEEFDSNIYGSHFSPHADLITELSPTVDMASDWNNDAIALHAEGDLSRHVRFTADNIGNAVVQADSRLDISRGQTFSLDAGFQSLHEDRSSPDAIAATAALGPGVFALYPTPFTVATGQFGYVYVPSRIGLELDGSVNAYSFSNVPTNAGQLIINSDRNREEYTLTPKLSYAFEPGYQAFIQIEGDVRTYDSTRDATPEHYRRSSSGYTAAIGSQFNIDRLIVGQFYVGWQNQAYDDPRLTPLSGVSFGGSVLWNVTQLTSLRFSASRATEETIMAGSSGLWDTKVTATIEHEALRNVLIALGLTYDGAAYQGTLKQNDDGYGFNASVRWKFNRNVSAGLSVNYTMRSSNMLLDRYVRDQILVDLKGQF